MNSLLKLANKVEGQLRKLALQNVLQQLNDLVSATYAVFQARNEIQKNVNSGDMYGQENSKAILKMIDSMYFAASGMKQDALTKGLSKADMESRKNRVLSLCDQASKFLQANGVPHATVASLGMNLVRAKAEELAPVTLPALQPPAKPSAPTETGVAYIEKNPGSKNWYSNPAAEETTGPKRWYGGSTSEEFEGATEEQLDEALNLLRPKPETANHSGIRQMPLRDVPEDAY